jgi:GxxExxY protein
MDDEELTEKIIGCAYMVHNVLGHGFLEKVYENALRIELERQGLSVKQQTPIKVYYEGEIVGDYFADLLVEQKVLIELKAVQNLNKEHEVQLVNYLTATDIHVGLLINFGLSVQIKRRLRSLKKSRQENSSIDRIKTD